MRRLKICFICRTWAPDAQDVNGTVLCLPCWGDVVNQTSLALHQNITTKARLQKAGGKGEPVVPVLRVGPDIPVPPAHGDQLEMFNG